MKTNKTYEYRGVKVEIVLFHENAHTDTMVHWNVFLDGHSLTYFTTQTGTLLLGRAVDHDIDAWGDDTDLMGTLVLDPAEVTTAVNGGVVPFSQGAGRWLCLEPSFLVAVESVPFSYIKPYIDHMLKMRELYNNKDVLAALESALTSPPV